MRKPHGGRLRVALAFPNTYFVGMSNLGFQTVYKLFNAEDGHRLRARVPAAEDRAGRAACVRRAAGDDRVADAGPRLRHLRVLGVVRVGLHQRADDAAAGRHSSRAPTQRTHHDPLVMIGGAVTFVNPEPLALFADVIAAGEGEALIPSLLAGVSGRVAIATICCGGWRTERGFYIPSFYDVQLHRTTARSTAFVPREGTGAPPVVQEGGAEDDRGRRSAGDDDLHARYRVRFALPRRSRPRLREPVPLLLGRLQLPARPRVSEGPHPRAGRAGAKPYSNRAGLVSIALCDHPRHRGDPDARSSRWATRISPASLRLDDLTPTILRLLRQSGERTITIAPETGSDRLRRVINKTVTNDEILAAAEMIFASGMENLKLYFMIGLPDGDRRRSASRFAT